MEMHNFFNMLAITRCGGLRFALTINAARTFALTFANGIGK
jgi:hypothetical protein